jgi:hypothetical protein
MGLTPYHQGHLDFFCAVYALINALRLTHGLRLEQAREILNRTLLEISQKPPLWTAFLQDQTDFYWLVDYILGRFCRRGRLALRMAKLPPFPARPEAEQGLLQLKPENPPHVPLEELREEHLFRREAKFESPGLTSSRPERGWRIQDLWPFLRDWLPERGFFSSRQEEKTQERCLLLRFHRFLPSQALPLISHWSTGWFFFRGTLQLYDCTQNKEGTQSLPPQECALYREDLEQGRLLLLEPESIYFLEKA